MDRLVFAEILGTKRYKNLLMLHQKTLQGIAKIFHHHGEVVKDIADELHSVNNLKSLKK